ncbi:MAG: DUF438 domain-containing protein [Deltaproteobacteria bacterium]|nr:DUF438 domain-containing protein [Deltaproteobacteria bacterium]
MPVEIGPKTRIHDLLREHPHLLEVLVARSPAFAKLRNPFLRKTMGKVATLENAAAIAGIPVDDLVRTLREAVSGPPQGPEERKEALKAILRELHDGAPVEKVKERFRRVLGGVDAAEIAAVEQALIDEGLPAEEIRSLCDVHVEIFKEALEERDRPHVPPGHPVHTYMKENRALEEIVSQLSLALGRLPRPGEPGAADALQTAAPELRPLLDRLALVDVHYARKENQLFPALEAHHFTGPTQVMWSIHDDIRGMIKAARQALDRGDPQAFRTNLLDALKAIRDMIYKEEHILFPASLDLLSHDEWVRMARGEAEIGFAWVEPDPGWPDAEAPPPEEAPSGAAASPEDLTEGPAAVRLDTGRLTPEQINLILTHLPVDVTFVDADDRVAYYSEGPHRIFPRSPGIIGREVRNCHPPKSVHRVNMILDAFKAGERDSAEFWLQLGGRFIHIRYFAVRDAAGRYQGTLEVSQDVTDIRTLEGERRLLDWE